MLLKFEYVVQEHTVYGRKDLNQPLFDFKTELFSPAILVSTLFNYRPFRFNFLLKMTYFLNDYLCQFLARNRWHTQIGMISGEFIYKETVYNGVSWEVEYIGATRLSAAI